MRKKLAFGVWLVVGMSSPLRGMDSNQLSHNIDHIFAAYKKNIDTVTKLYVACAIMTSAMQSKRNLRGAAGSIDASCINSTGGKYQSDSCANGLSAIQQEISALEREVEQKQANVRRLVERFIEKRIHAGSFAIAEPLIETATHHSGWRDPELGEISYFSRSVRFDTECINSGEWEVCKGFIDKMVAVINRESRGRLGFATLKSANQQVSEKAIWDKRSLILSCMAKDKQTGSACIRTVLGLKGKL